MGATLQDFRYAFRITLKSPGYGLAAVIVLGLGIGGNAAMFSILDALVIHPIDLPNLERLVSVLETEPSQVGPWNELSPANYLDWKRRAQSFDLFGVARLGDFNLASGGQPEFVGGARVSEDFFPVMGIQPEVGRFFTPEEVRDGADGRVAVLSHDLWVRRFGKDERIAGRTIRMNNADYTIVGVAPRALFLPFSPDLWIPMIMPAEEKRNRTNFALFGFARLKPGITAEQAQAEMAVIAQRLAREHPDTNTGRGALVRPLRRFVAGETQNFVVFQFGAVIFVLLIVCANVANLQLAQAAGRRKEIAMRLALGASGSRITRQLLTESLLLSLGGVIVAIAVAQWGLDATLKMMPADVKRYVPGWDGIGLSFRSVAFGLGVGVLSALLTGILPAIRARRPDLQSALREVRGTALSGRRLRSLLVLGEVGLSIVLLAGSALMTKGFVSLLQIGQQHDPETLLMFRVSVPPPADTREMLQITQLQQRIQKQLSTLPGVLHVSGTSFLPHSNRSSDDPFSVEGDPPRPSSEMPVARTQSTLPGYFATLKIPILRGRPIDENDGDQTARVVVISNGMAKRYFDGRDPIGRRIRVGHNQSESKWLTIVGVAGDTVHNWYDDRNPIPTVYQPLVQAPRRALDFAVRTAGDPYSVAGAVRAEIARIDPEMPLMSMKTMARAIHESFTGLRYSVYMLFIVSVVALLIATIGIYAVISYLVAERTHEIGVRVALGATSSNIRSSVLKRSMLLVGIGIAAGIAGAIGLAHLLSYFLFGVAANDVPAYAAVTVIFLAIAFLASYLPARRATRVDPMVALREL